LVATIVVAALALASCGDDGDGASDPQGSGDQTSGAVEADASYRTVDDLKDAAVASGYTCQDWKPRQKVRFAAESGSCSWADTFATFETESDVQKQVTAYRGIDDLLLEAGERPQPHLVGPNWIITGADAPMLQTALGGTVVKPNLH
jgi:hypothetical protein